MVAYVIVDIDVTDADLFAEYRKLVPATIAAHGGRYLVRGGAIESLEGDWTPSRVTVLEFPNVERAKTWLNSPEYATARGMRHRSARADMIVVEGLPD